MFRIFYSVWYHVLIIPESHAFVRVRACVGVFVFVVVFVFVKTERCWFTLYTYIPGSYHLCTRWPIRYWEPAVILLPELHADLFTRHASPLEACVFVAVNERGEDVVSDKICRRCNGTQQRRRRAGRSVQLPDWVMNKIKRQHIIALTLGHQNESLL